MVSEIRTFTVPIPAGTPLSAPAIVPVTFPPRIVTAVRWRVPPGPSGLMGWALTVAGNPVIPRAPGTYIVANDEHDEWPLEGYPDQGQWQVTGYNTDIYAHSVYLTFLLDQISAGLAAPALLPNAALSSPLPPALVTVDQALTVPQLAI